MNPYTGMLFLDGHIVDPELARVLVEPAPPAEAGSTDKDRCEAGSVHHGALASICGGVALSPFRLSTLQGGEGGVESCPGTHRRTHFRFVGAVVAPGVSRLAL